MPNSAPPSSPTPASQAGDAVVTLTNVSKTFGATPVLRDLNLTVPAGEIFGLIGPSGCGKTTAVRLLVGTLLPSAGEVRVLGTVPRDFTPRLREQIGYTPQGFTLYPTLTVAENSSFVAALYGLGWLRRRRRIREVLRFLELWEARGRLARDISGGMQRRLSLACALFHEPRLLFVDEPTAGLDPVLRAKIWSLLRDLRGRGVSIFVTTQHLDEAELCDRVAIMKEGRIAAVGSPQELRRRTLGGDTIEVRAADISRRAVRALGDLEEVLEVERPAPNRLRVLVREGPPMLPVLTRVLEEHGARIAAIEPRAPSFDDVFMRIVAQDGDEKPDSYAELL